MFQFTTFAPFGVDFDEGCRAHHHEQDPRHDIHQGPTSTRGDADSARNHHVLEAQLSCPRRRLGKVEGVSEIQRIEFDLAEIQLTMISGQNLHDDQYLPH